MTGMGGGSLTSLLLAVAVLAFESTQGLKCHSCAYGKVDVLEIGDPSCKTGGSSHVEECSEDTVVPTSALNPSSPRITLGDLRGKLSDPKMQLGKTVYGCALVEITAEVQGKPFYLFTRSCSFDTKARSECKTGSKKEFEADPDFPMEVDPTLGANTTIRACACYKDECKPEKSAVVGNSNNEGKDRQGRDGKSKSSLAHQSFASLGWWMSVLSVVSVLLKIY